MVPRSSTKAHVRFRDDIAFIDIDGDLTPDAREVVENAHKQVTDEGSRKIVLTFQPDAYINSGGIAVIINVAIAGTRVGQTIRLVQPSEHFQKIFTMVGLRQYVGIFGDEDEAVESL